MSARRDPRPKKQDSDVGNDDGIIPCGTVVWKRAVIMRPGDIRDWHWVTVKLLVLEPGIVPYRSRINRSDNLFNRRKCRVPAVRVLSITGTKSAKTYDEAQSRWCQKRKWEEKPFIYKVGNVARSGTFSSNKYEECAPGIHVFRTRDEAERFSM